MVRVLNPVSRLEVKLKEAKQNIKKPKACKEKGHKMYGTKFAETGGKK